MASIEEIRAGLERPASRGVVAGGRPRAEAEWTSWLGRVRLLGSQESWPEHDGEPMAGVCQINVRELPHVPRTLHDVALVTLFMRVEDGLPQPSPGAPNGRGWALRSYPTLHGLEPVADVVAPRVRPQPVIWELIQGDQPAWDDATRVLDADGVALDGANYDELFAGPADGLKVGGWPSLIQSEIFWAPFNRHPAEPDFVLQIDTDATTGLEWGHAGVVYIGRGTADPSTWALEWQCL